MPSKPKLNVHSFPRPPRLEKTLRHLQIKWNGHLIADTRDAYWVLETTHAPTYYLPRSSILVPLTPSSARPSFCEWKGVATYHALTHPDDPNIVVRDRAWSYEDPTEAFRAIQGFVSFYVGPWECFVDGEQARPQEGGFYGGWVTDELEGTIKGAPGTWGW